MAFLFRNSIRPMYSLGKNTLTVQLDSTYINIVDFRKAVVSYLNNIGITCTDTNKKHGCFDILELDGKQYLFEKRFLPSSKKKSSEIAILVEK